MTQTTTKASPVGKTEVDFDTRLMMADAAMDAILDHREALMAQAEVYSAFAADRAGAQAAVEDARAEAAMIEAEKPRFKPNPVLAKAHELIVTRGWTKGMYESPEGCVCALGAISQVVGHNLQSGEDAVIELLNRIAAETGNPATSVGGWNDTRDDVSQVLKLLY
jgi:hypothetical protein